MASVFVFHLRHQQIATALPNDDAILFPVGRDIKDFSLVAGKEKFSQQDFLGHWTLLFFGFTHCATVCPTTFAMLNRAYEQLHATYPNLQVVLVSLDPDRDSPTQITQYAHSFNPNFIGITGKIQDIRKLQSQFGIFAARDDSITNDYQIQHTSSILLISPQAKWAGLFKYGLPPKQFVKAYKASVQIVSTRDRVMSPT